MGRIELLSAAVVVGLLAATPAGAQTLPIDVDRLTARVDTFDILLHGDEFGTIVSEFRFDDDGFVLLERMVGQAGRQTTEVQFGPRLDIRSISQEGMAGTTPTGLSVTMKDGRAVGTARIPGRDEPQPLDVSVPDGVIDEKALSKLIEAVAWSEGASYKVNALYASSGEVIELTLSAGAPITVDVGGGTAETTPVTVSGGPMDLMFMVSTAAPARVVRYGPDGIPMVVVLRNSG